MKRRDVLFAFCAGLAARGVAGAPSKPRRVGILMLTKTGDGAMTRVLTEELANAGFKDGDVILDEQSIEFEGSRAAELARRLVAANPDVLYAIYEPMVEALRAQTARIPIVFIYVTDPVERGYVRAYSQPGGNMTGVTDRYVETGVKRLELLREIAPRARRVAFVSHFGDPLGLETWRATAARLRFTTIDVDLARPRSMEAALDAAIASGADCFFPIGSLKGLAKPEGASPVEAFMRFAERRRIPAVYSTNELVRKRRGLISLEVDSAHMFRTGAQMVIRILRGESAGAIAIEQPDRFSIAVNLSAAKSIGIAIPQAVLLRAAEVVD